MKRAPFRSFVAGVIVALTTSLSAQAQTSTSASRAVTSNFAKVLVEARRSLSGYANIVGSAKNSQERYRVRIEDAKVRREAAAQNHEAIATSFAEAVQGLYMLKARALVLPEIHALHAFLASLTTDYEEQVGIVSGSPRRISSLLSYLRTGFAEIISSERRYLQSHRSFSEDFERRLQSVESSLKELISETLPTPLGYDMTIEALTQEVSSILEELVVIQQLLNGTAVDGSPSLAVVPCASSGQTVPPFSQRLADLTQQVQGSTYTAWSEEALPAWNATFFGAGSARGLVGDFDSCATGLENIVAALQRDIDEAIFKGRITYARQLESIRLGHLSQSKRIRQAERVLRFQGEILAGSSGTIASILWGDETQQNTYPRAWAQGVTAMADNLSASTSISPALLRGYRSTFSSVRDALIALKDIPDTPSRRTKLAEVADQIPALLSGIQGLTTEIEIADAYLLAMESNIRGGVQSLAQALTTYRSVVSGKVSDVAQELASLASAIAGAQARFDAAKALFEGSLSGLSTFASKIAEGEIGLQKLAVLLPKLDRVMVSRSNPIYSAMARTFLGPVLRSSTGRRNSRTIRAAVSSQLRAFPGLLDANGLPILESSRQRRIRYPGARVPGDLIRAIRAGRALVTPIPDALDRSARSTLGGESLLGLVAQTQALVTTLESL